jgi:NTP pyrophosphatase (non-canonical NTP hydrolase)
MSDLSNLQKRVIEFRDERNWKQFHNPKDLAISLVLEATELLEHFQWKNPEEIDKHLAAHHNDVSDELVDVLYWVLLIANDLSIDLPHALENKMSQNEAKYPVAKSKSNHKKYTEFAE